MRPPLFVGVVTQLDTHRPIARCGESMVWSGLVQVENGTVDVAAELRALTGSLAREEGVFGRVVEEAGGSVPELVRRVAAEAEEA